MAPETIGEDTRTEEKGSWGPWATIAFTCLIVAVFVVAQTVLALVFLIVGVGRSANTSISAAAVALQADGFFVAVASVLAGSAALGIAILIAWLRKGPSLRDYLAIRPGALKTLLRWLVYTVIFAAASDGLSYLAGYPAVPDWMLDVYASARFLPLLLFALLVVAPVWEEVVFRGFLFEGLRRSRLGDIGAAVLASLCWASLHMQYEWFLVGQIFVAGLLFAAARSLTRSLVVPIAMHALFSGIATLQVALLSWK